jgi:hypothetical protein
MDSRILVHAKVIHQGCPRINAIKQLNLCRFAPDGRFWVMWTPILGVRDGVDRSAPSPVEAPWRTG